MSSQQDVKLTKLCEDLLNNTTSIYTILVAKKDSTKDIDKLLGNLDTQIKSIKTGMSVPLGKIVIKNKLETAFKNKHTINFYNIITTNTESSNYLKTVMNFVIPFFSKFNIELTEDIINKHFTDIDQLQMINIALNMYKSYANFVKS
jgi:hypothetical protein